MDQATAYLYRSLSAVNVSFLMDTDSPSIYLREKTLEALGYKENIPAVSMVDIHGITVQIQPSQLHFINVNLLGQDYLSSAQVEATLSYVILSALLTTGLK